MSNYLELIRGDRRDLAIADLVDGTGAPAVFAVNDIVRWTAKRRIGEPDDEAILRKDSANPGEIAFLVGGSTGTVTILGTDWDDVVLRSNRLKFVWDLQLAVGGNIDQIVTLVHGWGMITADTTLTAP